MSKPIPMRPRSYSDNYRRGEGDYRGKAFRTYNNEAVTYAGYYQPGPATPSGYRRNPPPAASSNYSRAAENVWKQTAPDAQRDYDSIKRAQYSKDKARTAFQKSQTLETSSNLLRGANTELATRSGFSQKYPKIYPNQKSIGGHEKRIREMRGTADKARSQIARQIKMAAKQQQQQPSK